MLGLKTVFSRTGDTSNVFDDMVQQFQGGQGGHFSSPLLDSALQRHQTTTSFNRKISQILSDHVFSNNKSVTGSITEETSSELSDPAAGVSLPKFNGGFDLINGTILCVHDVWAVQVYVDSLEYKGTQIRGKLRYEIQDHFGLDTPDINHSIFGNPLNNYELAAGFRSWYLLQHYTGYGLKPLFTDISFELEIRK